MARKTVCIIGAGPSGLVAAKTLVHNTPGHTFAVTLFDPLPRVGGLWPRRRDERGGLVHPLMVANQSRHTMQFSDFAWDPAEAQLPRAWRVGRYLEGYAQRYLLGRADVELTLGTKVVKIQRRHGGGGVDGGREVRGEEKVGDGEGWDVWVEKTADAGYGRAERREFDSVIIASGFFGKPIVDTSFTANPGVPVVHSSQYRDLESLLKARTETKTARGKILVMGGQMSGVEIAGTIASHVSAAQNSPGPPSVPDPSGLSVHHLVQRPTWVFPLFTAAKASTAPHFLPLDCSSYNLNDRPRPLVNSQGHIPEQNAIAFNGLFRNVLGTDQAEFHPLMRVAGDAASSPQFMAVSDTYADFVRAGRITLQQGKLASIRDGVAATSSGETISEIAAVVLATGFDASPSLSFLPHSILARLHHDPTHRDLPIALALHGAVHPDVPGLGFVGFYRSPYWGVIEMQARVLAALWTPEDVAPRPAGLDPAADAVSSIKRTIALRSDPRRSQFPMGDYAFIMDGVATALGMAISEPSRDDRMPTQPHNGLVIDLLTPARYLSPYADDQARREVRKNIDETQATLLSALTTPRFVAKAVFRSLLGTWKLERELESKLASHPSGHFSGKAQFRLRDATSDGLQSATGPPGGQDKAKDAGGSASAAKDDDDDDDDGADGGVASRYLEYLYVEEGEFRNTSGLVVPASRRYVWRYDEARDVLSVWFVRPEEPRRTDYLFHEVDFAPPGMQGGDGADSGNSGDDKVVGWRAGAGHLCVEDFYNVKYDFRFAAVNLAEWRVGYDVKGPAKDYTIRGRYTR